MPTQALVEPTTPEQGLTRGWRMAVVGAAFALGLVARFVCGWGAPFWFDETFTGVIARQTTVGGLIEWCLHELTGPAFYMPLWVWEKIVGPSDVALRIPSIVASLAAPAILLWRGHPDRDMRVIWATLAALWAPGIVLAGDARPYSLLFLLGCVQAVLFLRLMRVPRITTALAWTSVSALFVLTHYHSVVITGLQGMAYLALHRRAALRTWPALAPLVPMAVWMALHLPFVLGYASTGGWYEKLPPGDVLMAPYAVFGSEVNGALIFAIVAYVAIRGRALRTRSPARVGPEAALALCGIIAFAVIFGSAFVRPSFTPRYLTSAMPALLFGFAAWGRWSLRARGTVDAKPLSIVIAIMAIIVIGEMRVAIAHPEQNFRRQFNLEAASAWLLERHPDKLVFYWDSAVVEGADRARIAEVGAFFLRRAGQAVVTTVPRITAHDDPNAIIAAQAGNDPSVAVLWALTDHALIDKARYPHLDRDRRWQCRNFGSGTTIVFACRRPA